MLKKSLLGLLIILAFSFAAASQIVYTPQKGSAERTAILNVLRVPVEKELKQKILLNVEKFNVQGIWAFLSGVPENPKGGSPNYKKTPYQRAIDADSFDNNFFSLLKKTGGKWKIVTYAIGCTDVCYATWSEDYKAPKAVFPYTE